VKILVIDTKTPTIKTDANSIKVDDKSIPFHLIESIIVVGKATLDTNDINRITSLDKSLILINYNFQKSSLITSSFSKTNELKLKQYKAITQNQLNIAKYILTQKIISHQKQLNLHDKKIDITTIKEKIQKADTLETLLGIEGSFSKAYFKTYFLLFPKVLHKSKRTKRPPKDPVNAMLSFYYMIFYNILTVRLLAFGFESGLGFLHKPFRSHQALSSDILEFFRADINELVYQNFNEKLLKSEDFTKKDGVYLRYEARKRVWKVFKDFLEQKEPDINKTITQIRKML